MTQSPARQEQANFLGACLVESDSEFEKRSHTIKRRALVASIVLQALVVAALVLFPLLSKGESIATYTATPVPPYHRGTVTEHRQHEQRPPDGRRSVCTSCFRDIPPSIATVDHRPIVDNPVPGEADIPGTEAGRNIPGSLDNFVTRREPPPPQPTEPARPRTVRVTGKVQEARLIRRIQPIYPPLAVQIRREGRVELRAIIATDGRVQSLEVISGEPLLIPSALNAVREWRYQPTLLNGEPVEVDTYITVIYTLNR